MDLLNLPFGGAMFLFGSCLGTLIFYVLSSQRLDVVRDDLVTQTDNLLKVNLLMMNVMEQKGWVKWRREAEGSITGEVKNLSASTKLTLKDEAAGKLATLI